MRQHTNAYSGYWPQAVAYRCGRRAIVRQHTNASNGSIAAVTHSPAVNPSVASATSSAVSPPFGAAPACTALPLPVALPLMRCLSLQRRQRLHGITAAYGTISCTIYIWSATFACTRLQLHTSIVQPPPCRPFLLQAFIRARPAAECPLLPCVRLISLRRHCCLQRRLRLQRQLYLQCRLGLYSISSACAAALNCSISPCAAPTIAPSAALTFTPTSTPTVTPTSLRQPLQQPLQLSLQHIHTPTATPSNGCSNDHSNIRSNCHAPTYAPTAALIGCTVSYRQPLQRSHLLRSIGGRQPLQQPRHLSSKPEALEQAAAALTAREASTLTLMPRLTPLLQGLHITLHS